MEHRHGKRNIVNIAAIASFVTGISQPVRITNVSLSGIQINVASKHLNIHTPVTLRFRLHQPNHQNKMKEYRWSGFITRLSEKGAGAMFNSANPEEQAGLLALLDVAQLTHNRPTVETWYW
jgi:hypothetical protein